MTTVLVSMQPKSVCSCFCGDTGKSIDCVRLRITTENKGKKLKFGMGLESSKRTIIISMHNYTHGELLKTFIHSEQRKASAASATGFLTCDNTAHQKNTNSICSVGRIHCRWGHSALKTHVALKISGFCQCVFETPPQYCEPEEKRRCVSPATPAG